MNHDGRGAAARRDDTSGVWVFGYGSLVWRPSFDFLDRRPAWVAGFSRRFWQGSTDHRGVPSAPGRVVTLREKEGVTCWGVAYRLAPQRAHRVLEHLDWREKGGYERRDTQLHFRAGVAPPSGPVRGILYLATASNRNYLGPAPLDVIAAQVLRSRGPSGTNLEYVLRLADGLRAIDAEDAHVFELESIVRESRSE